MPEKTHNLKQVLHVICLCHQRTRTVEQGLSIREEVAILMLADSMGAPRPA